MTSDLKRAVCLEPFIDPKLLPCLHTFCLRCLKNQIFALEVANGVHCGKCQKRVGVPPEGVEGLPQNLHVLFEAKMAEILRGLGETSAGVVAPVCCDGCMPDAAPSFPPAPPAKVYCSHCRELLCQLCTDHHLHHHRLRLHQLVPLEGSSRGALEACMRPPRGYCRQPDHVGQTTDFFCRSCRDTVCRYCLLEGHSGHGCVPVEEAARGDREEVTRSLESAQGALHKLTNSVEDIEAKLRVVEAERQEAVSTLSSTFEELQNCLRRRLQLLVSRVDDIATTKANSLTAHKERLLGAKEELASCSNTILGMLQSHSDEEMVSLKGFPHNRLCTVLSEVGLIGAPEEQDDMVVAVDSKKLLEEISKLGAVNQILPSKCTWEQIPPFVNTTKLKLQAKSKEGVPVACKGLIVKAEMISKNETLAGQVDDQGDGTYTISFTGRSSGNHQICILVNGRHVCRSPCDLPVQ